MPLSAIDAGHRTMVATNAIGHATTSCFGQRVSHSSSRGMTRLTGVCCSMNSLTSVPQGVKPSRRQGRSRRFSWYQVTTVPA